MAVKITRPEAISHLRKVLMRRRDALRRALAGDMSLLRELQAESRGDAADFASDAVHDEINSQLAEVESRELLNIEGALERMQDSSYGNCDHCDEPIPLARLQALPYATLCIRCQREVEKQSSRRGDAGWRRGSVGEDDHGFTFQDVELDVI